MLEFLEDCQLFLKICGYSAHNLTDALRYRWSSTVNPILGYLCIYYIVASIAFLCDDQQPYDERIFQVLVVLAYSEVYGTHYTFTANKVEIFDFFNHFGKIVNQSKFENNLTNFFFLTELFIHH